MNNKNLANAQLLNSIGTSDTTIEVKQGQGADLPTVPFHATLTPLGVLSTNDNSEIVQVTAKSTDALTVVRAQRGTTAKTFAADSVIANSIYIEDINGKATKTAVTDALPTTVGAAGKALTSDGTNILWEDAGSSVVISETPPPDAEEGDMWGDTSETVEVPKWVTNEMIADYAVDTPQIADQAVTASKVDFAGFIETVTFDFPSLTVAAGSWVYTGSDVPAKYLTGDWVILVDTRVNSAGLWFTFLAGGGQIYLNSNRTASATLAAEVRFIFMKLT